MNRRKWLKISGLMAGSGLVHSARAAQEYALQAGCGMPSEMPSEFLRMGSNENPYGPSPKTLEAMQAALPMANRYPATAELRTKIGQRFGVSGSHVLLGAGSAEILSLSALLSVAQHKGSVVAAKPSFDVFQRVARKIGATVIEVPLTTDKKHDLQAMASAITADTRAVYLCNPNNPTGTKLPFDEIKSFVEELSKKYLVVADEVYHEFINEASLTSMVSTNKNLIVARSFSKVYGLAGMRIGYAVAHPDTIRLLSNFIPWADHAISQVTQAAALAAWEDVDFVKMCVQKNDESRQMLYSFLRQNQIEFIESFTNCSYFSLDKLPASFVKRMEDEKKILVRQYDDYGKLYCRVSTGKPEEMQQFVNAMKTMM